MSKEKVERIFSSIRLGFLWLFASPVYALIRVFVYKRKVGSTLLFTMLSPFTWLLCIILYYITLANYNHVYKLTSRGELSQIMGVDLPAYRIVDKTIGEISFNGDYSNVYVIEFKALPDEVFYAKLDSVCKADSYWYRSAEGKQVKYSYHRMWGNDIEAPKGQDPDEDMFVSLVLLKGEKKASLEKGSW